LTTLTRYDILRLSKLKEVVAMTRRSKEVVKKLMEIEGKFKRRNAFGRNSYDDAVSYMGWYVGALLQSDLSDEEALKEAKKIEDEPIRFLSKILNSPRELWPRPEGI
jgi:hypothetical protein